MDGHYSRRRETAVGLDDLGGLRDLKSDDRALFHETSPAPNGYDVRHSKICTAFQAAPLSN